MRQLLLIFLTIALLSACISENSPSNDTDKYGLKGNVISFEEVSYKADYKFGEVIEVKREWDYEYENDKYIIFNKGGFIIEEYYFNPKYSFGGYTTFEYDKNNRISNEKEYFQDSTLSYITFYKYDFSGNIEEKTRYDSEKNIIEKVFYEYNINGDKEKEIFNYNERKWKEIVFNHLGNEIEITRYDTLGAISSKRKYKYDDKGNRIESTWFLSDGNLSSLKKSVYDDNNKLISSIDYNSDGEKNSEYNYAYDEQGNPIEIKWIYHFLNTSETTTYEYDYDDFNNWINRIEYKDNIPQFIVRRIIGYDSKKNMILINNYDLICTSKEETEETEVIEYTTKKLIKSPQKTITYEKYQKIQNGMTYDELFNIIGVNGIEMSRVSISGYTTVSYSWENLDGSNIIVMLQNGKVISKAQAGL